MRLSIDTFLTENNLFKSSSSSICISSTQEFSSRLAEATRAFLVALVSITVLIIPGEAILPSPWLGSVFAVRTLQMTLGDTIIAARDVFIPMIPISGVGYGMALILDGMSTTMYSILLPFVVGVGTLAIMLCPWSFLTKKNLMLVVFYLLVASPLSIRSSDDSTTNEQEELPDWFLASFMGTITIGICVSVGVHCFALLMPRSTAATRLSLRTMKQLSDTTYNLLHSVSLYTNNLGKDAQAVMRARSLIDFYISTRKQQLKTLSGYVDAIHAESCITKLLQLIFGDSQRYCHIYKLEKFVQCARRQQQHADIIHLATRKIFLGEKYTHTNETVRYLKTMISDQLGYAVEQLATQFQQAEACYFFTSACQCDNSIDELKLSLGEYILAMKKTYLDSDKLTSSDELDIDSKARSLIGPKIRIRVVQISVYSFVHELIDTLRNEQDEKAQPKAKKTAMPMLKSVLTTPWLHKNPLKLRLALKTALGMLLASLWVSIPYLREEIAYPNSMWVGITVAVISLESTGSSVIKAIDRLWGTLIAGAYALLVARLLPYEIMYVGIASYAVFAFIAILLKNPQRSYASECAVTSLGSILFGSSYNSIEVHEYVTQRIMLIFIGVATFLFVELAVFPRSSRSIVQACALKWFNDLQSFLLDASETCRSISNYHCNNCEVPSCLKDEPFFMLRRGHKDMTSFTSNLANELSTLKDTHSVANSELKPATLEPSLGLHAKLHGLGYEKLFHEQERCISQLEVLVTCINSLIGYYSILSQDDRIRELQRPELIGEIVDQLAQQLQACIFGVRLAFPNGICEPGSVCVSSIIASLSRFRNFEAVRVSILTKSIAQSHAEYFKMMISSEEVCHITGFRTTVALAASAVLTIAQCLQFCGLHLEEIARSFPLENKDFGDNVND